MKLITLGCSLTAFEGVKEELARLINADLLNLAYPAGSNQLQINRLHEMVIDNQIDREDVVYWQITSIDRKYDRLPMSRFAEVSKIQQEQFADGYHHYVCGRENIFDKKSRIDLLNNTPIETKKIDIYQDLQMLLATIIMLSRMAPKTIIVIGWNNLMPVHHLTMFKNYLTDHHINFIDQSYLEYAVDRRLLMLDDMHPSKEAGQEYAKKVVHPKLISLGWV